jgi:tetratricopeptide (TPR) repeat protein
VSKSKILYAATGILAGFVIGFGFANAINRRQQDSLRAELQHARSSTQKTNGAFAESWRLPTDDPNGRALSEDEIQNAIKSADARPRDLYLQKNLGLALYAYRNRTRDTASAAYLPDVARLLKRACDANPKDREAIATLGNVLFDIAQKTSEPSGFNEARAYYEKALALQSNDADMRTDLGLTYFFGRPSDPQRAIIEYHRALAIDPRHEQALQNLAAALIKTGQREEAVKRLDELQSMDANNPALPDLRAQLQQSRNGREE